MPIFKGRTLEEAKRKGLKELGIDEKHAEITILQHPNNGAFGLFTKEAEIEIIEVSDSEIAQKKLKEFKEYFLLGAIIFGCLLVLLINGILNSTSSPKSGIAVPDSSDNLEDQNYKVVVKQLEAAGFTNIATEEIDDLVTGWIESNGEVEKVLIGSQDSFSNGDRFDKDVKIIVSYHTFPNKKNADSPSESKSDSSSENSSESSSTTENSSDNQEATLKAYVVEFQNYNIYYLIDEQNKTIKENTTDNIGVQVASYTGDMNSRIEFNLGGLDMIAHYVYEGNDTTAIFKDASGNENKARKTDVSIAQKYINQ